MKIEMHKSFLNSLQKRVFQNKKLYERYKVRLMLFQFDRGDPTLKDHALTGGKLGYISFSVTGDVRVVYKMVDVDTVLFVDIGSHNQVY